MKKYRFVAALLALMLIVSMAAGCSVKSGKDRIGKASDPTGEVKRDLVNAFFTSNLDGRYSAVRAGMARVVSQSKPAVPDTDSMIGEANISFYDYHASLLPYATDECITRLMANTNMNLMVDHYAAINKLWLVPRDATFTQKETPSDASTLYDVTVVCEAYEDETQNYLYDVTFTGELNTITVDGVEKVDRIYITERVDNR